jgi:hypothetical protein
MDSCFWQGLLCFSPTVVASMKGLLELWRSYVFSWVRDYVTNYCENIVWDQESTWGCIFSKSPRLFLGHTKSPSDFRLGGKARITSAEPSLITFEKFRRLFAVWTTEREHQHWALLTSLNHWRSKQHFGMDMSYTRVLHPKVAHSVVIHKWRHAFYVTRPLLCARITCCREL